MANLTYAPAQKLGRSGKYFNGDWKEQFPFELSQSLILIGKIAWLFFLLSLFALSFLAWIWIVSFRSGWRFGEWVKERSRPEEVPIGLFYGMLVLLISPFFLFYDWAQAQFKDVLPEWMKLPVQIPFRERFEEQLGIILGEEFPFFIKKVEEPADATATVLPEEPDR